MDASGIIKFATGLLLFGLLLTSPVRAQDCSPGTASSELNVNNVRATLYNTGSLFWAGSGQGYEVPKGSGTHSMFTASLWVGGLVNDQVRTAASTYGPYEFFPGPLDENGEPPIDCTSFDRIWNVRQEDILAYENGDTATTDLREWPVNLGAPVVDGDGISDNYNLEGGDRPDIIGDQMAWWIMNDEAGPHDETISVPIGIEVRVSAHAFESNTYLNDATFYRFRITYQGNSTLDSAYVGLFMDPDVGDATDDYFGTDSTLQMAYAYNGDDIDAGGYGGSPPAIGALFVSPNASSSSINKGENFHVMPFDSYVCPVCDWSSAATVYAQMQAYWPDGLPLTRGGNGRGGSDRICCAYPAHPPAYWSELSVDNTGTANTPFERKFVMSTGPFSMEPNTTDTIQVAILWAQGISNLGSVDLLYEIANAVSPSDTEEHPEIAKALSLEGSFPNPVRTTTKIALDIARPSMIAVAVYDVLGRKVLELPGTILSPADARRGIKLDMSTLASGIYFYRVTASSSGEKLQASGKLVRIK